MSLLRKNVIARLYLAAGAAIVVILVACGDERIPPEALVTLRGRVTDQVSLLPLDGVAIKRNGWIEDSTDAIGGYRIVYLNAVPEFDSLSFQKDGYLTKLVSLQNATRTDSRVWTLNVELNPD
jgi:hypothetical protein